MKKLLLLISCSVFATQLSAQWTTRCGAGDGMVVDLAMFDTSIYATGFFTNICGTSAAHIARWDGTTWYPMGTGLDDAGHTISVIDTQMYLAQYKQVIDSNWVRVWDGASFTKFGQGVYLTTAVVGASKVPNLYDVVKYNGKLVVSGEFDRAADKHISGIMQWNGTSWDSLGSGLAGAMGPTGVMYPHDMLVTDTSLYVVGNFTTAGGVTVNGVARWDGTSWHAMGDGFNSVVYGIGVFNNEIYVGGDFTMSGSTSVSCIAKWNGTAWVNPGFGIYATGAASYAYVHSIQQIGSRVIFEGGFNHVAFGTDSFIANNIIAYNGFAIDTLDGGVPTANFEGLIALDTTTILVGGALFPGVVHDTTNVSQYHFHAPLSVPNSSSKNASNIYPNPCSDVITISCKQRGNTLRMFTPVGQEVFTTKLNDYTATVSTSQLAAGMYILQVVSADGTTEYTKLIKK